MARSNKLPQQKTPGQQQIPTYTPQQQPLAKGKNDKNKKGKKGKQQKPKIKWRTKKWTIPAKTDIAEQKLKLNNDNENVPLLRRYSSPMQFFSLFMNKDIIEHITFQSNLYATQVSQSKGSKSIKNISKSEIETVIGIILLMGIHKLPNR